MKKRFFLLALVLILACSLLSISVSAADVIASGKHDGGPVTWTLTSDGVLTISGNRSMQDKNTYEWANYANQITRVVVENGITNIPVEAFSGYSKLESVSIGNAVTVIGENAFANCSKLKNVTFPASVTEIGVGAFWNCTSLKDVSFASGSKLEILGGSAFQGSGLTKVTLPSSLQKIGNYAYMECASLTEAILPEGLVIIGENAFQDCSALKTLSLPSTLEQVMYDAFLRCFNIQRVELYTACGISSIPCQDSLTTVVIGDSVTSIAGNAFSGFVKLTDVTIGKSVEVIGRNSFKGCTALKSITVPSSVVEIGTGAFSNTGLSSVVIPDSVTELGDSAFSGCADLESVQLSKNVVYLRYSTFANCTSLKEINLKNITEIDFEAFEGCTALTNVELAAVKTIGYYAFKDCTALKEITLPETLVQLDHGVFYGCIALADVTLPEDLNTLSTDLFTNCTSLVEITIPAGVESMGGRVFKGCTRLETIYFEGDAPVFSEDSFDGLTCLVIYPADNKTWTKEVQQNYGGTITWSPSHTHDYSAVVTAPTCTERGYTTYTCVECGNAKIEDYVDSLGHEYSEVVFVSKEEGHNFTCARCAAVSYGTCSFECTVLQEPTLETYGIRQYVCTICSGSYQEEYVGRIAGSDRIATALAVATELKEVLGVDKFDAIIIAAGGTGSDKTKFADALSGSYLASVKGAPILLYTKGALADANLEFIQKNLSANGTIYLLGGEAAVPAEVETALSGYAVKRLKGNDRYETNRVILNEVGLDDADEILIATGTNFADCLSASATGLPIMLVKGTNTELNAQQIEFLNGLKGKKFTILGGEAAVSAELEAAIEELIGADVERIKGEKREETSTLIAKKYFATADYALIAYSKNYPDGLAGGVLANALGAPLLLSNTGNEKYASAYVEEIGIEGGYILGGTAAVTDETAKIIFDLT